MIFYLNLFFQIKYKEKLFDLFFQILRTFY